MSTTARIDELRKKFEENPRRYFAPLANEYRKTGELAQAIALCREHLPKQPGHMSGYIVFGQALLEAGELAEARAVFEQALDLDPENLIALGHLGNIAEMNGDRASARRWWARVLDADPRNDDIAARLAGLATGQTPVSTPAVVPSFDALSRVPETPALPMSAIGFESMPTPDSVLRAVDVDAFSARVQRHSPIDLDAVDESARPVSAEPALDSNPTPAAPAADDPFDFPTTASDDAVDRVEAYGDVDFDAANNAFFEEGLAAPEWPDTSDLVARIVTPRSFTPPAVHAASEVDADDAIRAFGREAHDPIEPVFDEPAALFDEPAVETPVHALGDLPMANIEPLTTDLSDAELAEALFADEESVDLAPVAGPLAEELENPVAETVAAPAAEFDFVEDLPEMVASADVMEVEEARAIDTPTVAEVHDHFNDVAVVDESPARDALETIPAWFDGSVVDDVLPEGPTLAAPVPDVTEWDAPVAAAAMFDEPVPQASLIDELVLEESVAEESAQSAPEAPVFAEGPPLADMIDAVATSDARSSDDVWVAPIEDAAPTMEDTPLPWIANTQETIHAIEDGPSTEAGLEEIVEAFAEDARSAGDSAPMTIAALDEATNRTPSSGAPAFVTETMAELLVSQGFVGRAVDVYQELVRRRPADPVLSDRLGELRALLDASENAPLASLDDVAANDDSPAEIFAASPDDCGLADAAADEFYEQVADAVADAEHDDPWADGFVESDALPEPAEPGYGVFGYATPAHPTPVFATPVSSHTPVSGLFVTPAVTPYAQPAIEEEFRPRRSAREWFAELAARRVPRRTPPRATVVVDTPSVMPEGLASLFGASTSHQDDAAARALADAFSPVSPEALQGGDTLDFEYARSTPAFSPSMSATATPGHVPAFPPTQTPSSFSPPVGGQTPEPENAGFAFDKFFPDPAMRRGTPAAASPNVPDAPMADDLAQFSAWLKGLGNT